MDLKIVLTLMLMIYLFNDTWPDHIAYIRLVLTSLRQAKLTKPSKCYFCFQQLEFLALIVENGKVRLTQEKVRAILKMPVQTTTRKVRNLIGFMILIDDLYKGLQRLHLFTTNIPGCKSGSK